MPTARSRIDEFFAVACEAYFVNRKRFETEFPALMPLFDGFFGTRRAADAGREPLHGSR